MLKQFQETAFGDEIEPAVIKITKDIQEFYESFKQRLGKSEQAKLRKMIEEVAKEVEQRIREDAFKNVPSLVESIK